jgi:hypothetical protein
LYGFVVSINVDTIYASFYLDLSQGPQTFTIPQTDVHYSLLTLDVFGDVFPTSIPAQTPGTYALVPVGWNGTLPPGVTKVVQVPYPVTTWIIRADKYSPTGQNQIDQATAFRAALRLVSPQHYSERRAGSTAIVPEAVLAPRMKAIVDEAVTSHTAGFFRVLQSALRSPATAPLSEDDLKLSSDFNELFAAANAAAWHGNRRPLSQMIAGARAAHTMIIDNWLSQVDSNQWIYDPHFANWGRAYLDRASGNEWIQYGNNTTTAGYYNAFKDGSGAPLDGSKVPAYRLTFGAGTCQNGCIPQAMRFWSVTAYLPRGNTLVPNAAMKYNVARYTPGLVTNADGSITIYIQPTPPAGRLRPNWLPAPRGEFDLLLRVYGPEGNTSPGPNYYPPKIHPAVIP